MVYMLFCMMRGLTCVEYLCLWKERGSTFKGTLTLTQNYVCFYSKVFGRRKKVWFLACHDSPAQKVLLVADVQRIELSDKRDTISLCFPDSQPVRDSRFCLQTWNRNTYCDYQVVEMTFAPQQFKEVHEVLIGLHDTVQKRRTSSGLEAARKVATVSMGCIDSLQGDSWLPIWWSAVARRLGYDI